MVDKTDLSLDEIIKSTKGMHVGRRGGSGGARRGGGGGGGRGSVRGGNAPRRQSGGGSGSGSAGVMKGRNRGGGIAKPRYARGDVNSAWKHDMYDGAKRRNSGAGGPVGAVGGSGTREVTKLMVGNLDYGVSESDIKELFSEFGPLRSAAVHYDRSGRSLGTADVVFERRGDAIKAQTQYNGVPLDGRPMNISLAVDGSAVTASAKSRVGVVGGGGGGGAGGFGGRKPVSPRRPIRGRGGAGRNGTGGGRGGSGGRGGGRREAAKPAPTAAELDAELDAYVKDMK